MSHHQFATRVPSPGMSHRPVRHPSAVARDVPSPGSPPECRCPRCPIARFATRVPLPEMSHRPVRHPSAVARDVPSPASPLESVFGDVPSPDASPERRCPGCPISGSPPECRCQDVPSPGASLECLSEMPHPPTPHEGAVCRDAPISPLRPGAVATDVPPSHPSLGGHPGGEDPLWNATALRCRSETSTQRSQVITAAWAAACFARRLTRLARRLLEWKAVEGCAEEVADRVSGRIASASAVIHGG
jgi:hypothetical protein